MDTTGLSEIRANPMRPAVLLWPLQIFMGFTFLYAGLQHLTDPSYFDPSMAGYIGKLVVGYAVGSPIHAFLIGVVEPNAVAFGYSVAIGECLIGIAVLTGFLFKIAAFAGLFLNFTFYLSATWNAFPFYFGSDIVFVMCWLTLLLTGPQPKYSVDSVLAMRHRSLSWLVPKQLQGSLQTNVVKPIETETPEVQVPIPSKATLYPNQVREINNAFDRIKRQFILHRETQTMLEFVRAFVISLGVDRNDAVRILTALQNVLTRRPTEGATTKLGDALTQ